MAIASSDLELELATQLRAALESECLMQSKRNLAARARRPETTASQIVLQLESGRAIRPSSSGKYSSQLWPTALEVACPSPVGKSRVSKCHSRRRRRERKRRRRRQTRTTTALLGG